MRRSIPHLAERLRLRLWIVPVAFALVAAVAALVLVWLEDQGESFLPLALEIDPVSARSLLGAIASAMISFTALVFSVTMLVLQLASSQLSPRVMRTFLRDRFNQVVLGLFVATFVFALLLLVSITDVYVPDVGVFVAIVLVFVSVLAFVAYIDHMAHAVGPSDVIASIATETRQVVDRLYPADGEEPSAVDVQGLPRVVHEARSPHTSGYVVVIDEQRLATIAAEGDHVIEVLVGTGTFVVQGEPLLRVHGGPAGEHLDDVASAFTVAKERTMNQDPGFGLRQLIDIALKALSPSMNDQTTANRVIDQLHDLLRMLRDRPLPSPRPIEVDGRLRVLVPGIDWEGYVISSVAEIDDASRELPFVRGHLRRMVEGLAADAAPERLTAIRLATNLLDAGPERAELPRSMLS